MKNNQFPPPSMRYVSRPNNSTRSSGYFVRVGTTQKAVKNDSRPKWFADSQWGGKTAALKAAKAYRDTEVARLGIVIQRKNHTSYGQNFGRGYGFSESNQTWIAQVTTTQDDGSRKQAKMSFSISKWGIEAGETMAALAAEAMLDGIIDTFRSNVRQGAYNYLLP